MDVECAEIELLLDWLRLGLMDHVEQVRNKLLQYNTVESQINVSHIKDISQINNVVVADQMAIYYISTSQINNNLTLTIDLPLTNNIVNLRFDCNRLNNY